MFSTDSFLLASNLVFSVSSLDTLSFIFPRLSSRLSSSALCLIEELVFLLIAPPVIEPPLFITCPSRVIIRFLKFILRAIRLALSILSTIIVSPNRCEIIFLYVALTSIRFSAILIKPSSFTKTL